MLKKLAVALAALAISAPALADRGRGHYKHEHRAKHQVVHHYYQRPHYRPAQRVVVVHRPQPVYVQPAYHYRVDPHTGALIVVGAVLGAVIGHHMATSY